MDYISCFSGIGGLEATYPPLVYCELDSKCRDVLASRYPKAKAHDDIRTLKPPRAEIVAGGWPCQDLSIAGKQKGLSGDRSGLLVELLRVARAAKAHSLIAENVANLLRMRDGKEFRDALKLIHAAGFPYVAWRVMNARDFGLPQHRTRLLMIASKREEIPMTIFRTQPKQPSRVTNADKIDKAAGFYWSAGIHSINYSRGYVPTVKVGSSLEIASPPAVHYGNVVRLLSPIEALRLQGFQDRFEQLTRNEMYRAAGNAVARPVGEWVFSGVTSASLPSNLAGPQIVDQTSFFDSIDCDNVSQPTGKITKTKTATILKSGQSIKGTIFEQPVETNEYPATNLIDYINKKSNDRLSTRAAKGLLLRLARSGQECPPALLRELNKLAV